MAITKTRACLETRCGCRKYLIVEGRPPVIRVPLLLNDRAWLEDKESAEVVRVRVREFEYQYEIDEVCLYLERLEK
jgi:hypothetical protein